MRDRRGREVHRLVLRTVGTADHEVRAESLHAAMGVHHALRHAGGATGGPQEDDIIHVDTARKEHGRFVAILERFTRVYQVKDLLLDILDRTEVRELLRESHDARETV